MSPPPPSQNAPPVLFTVTPQAGVPIYMQLVEQITRMVAGGRLAAGEALPSVRDVAHALVINPMTVSKAYSLLETQGVLARQRGLGMVVALHQPQRLLKSERLNLLRPVLQRAAEEAAQLEIDRDTAVRLFDKILRDKK